MTLFTSKFYLYCRAARACGPSVFAGALSLLIKAALVLLVVTAGAPSRSNAIFNKIFEQYAQGADVAATWKESLSSKPFRTGDVGDER